jgi:hypothetical protein
MWKSKKGSVLIVLIITMTIMAVLGAAMAIFLASSSLTELYLNQANQAQYLAESGIRFGYSSSSFSFSTTPYNLANVPGQINISKTVNNYIISTGIINSGNQNQRRTIKWGPGSGTNGGGRPPHNIAVLSTSGSTTPTLLTSLDSNFYNSSTPQVTTIQGQAANGCGGSTETFVMFQYPTTLTDPDTSCNISPKCTVGYLIVPLTTTSTAPLQQAWTTYGRVSYDVQVKVGWMISSGVTADAAQGINIRWHANATWPTKYEGYGLSFMEYKSRIACAVDYVPCNIKPCVGNPCGADNSLATRLLLVLWQQKVVGGIETRTWLAYANLGDVTHPFTAPGDPKVLGTQNANDGQYVDDNASLVIRIEDKISFTGIRYNDIKIYYGDNSDPTLGRTTGPPATRGFDAAATNINRGAYAPICTATTWTPSWPSNIYEPYTDNTTSTYWSYSGWWPQTSYIANNIVIPDYRTNTSDGNRHNYKCTTAGTSGNIEPTWPASTPPGGLPDNSVKWTENGDSGARPTSYDYFTMVSANPPPVPGTNTVSLTVNSTAVDDVSTIPNPTKTIMLLSDRATIRTYDFTLTSFPTTRPEVALHAMGNLTNTQNVGFTDLAIQILGKAE